MDHLPEHGISQAVAMPGADILECIVVTPEAPVHDGSAQLVALPLDDGEMAIMPFHGPLIARLGFGELRIIEEGGGKTLRYFIDGGFVQVAGNNMVYVLTNRATPVDQIDVEAAQEQLAAAMRRPAVGDAQLEARARDEARARMQIRIATRDTAAAGH
ncbi:MAG TPA: ATP synthase F1 subunit epsilon [Pirellulales bacterium]|jgi:F-type H+-transporting ATPase subunit epsilon|nr:ATP synthase F1 subunit epsilon [Pirellulales bacterium]